VVKVGALFILAFSMDRKAKAVLMQDLMASSLTAGKHRYAFNIC